MTRVIPKAFNDELDKLEQDAIITFYVLDTSKAYPGGQVHYFLSGLNENAQDVTWQGNKYRAFPSGIDGISFGKSGNSKPTFAISNVTGLITGLIINYNDLVGCELTMKMVCVKFLDAVNFENGNPNADPNQETSMKYIVNKMNQVTDTVAAFELALPGENTRAQIPKHIITVNMCQWVYRKGGCPYKGTAYFDHRDRPTTDVTKDVCSHLESGCIARFGADSALPLLAFLAVDKVST